MSAPEGGEGARNIYPLRTQGRGRYGSKSQAAICRTIRWIAGSTKQMPSRSSCQNQARGFGGVAPGTSHAVLDSGETADGLPSICVVRWHLRNGGREQCVTTFWWMRNLGRGPCITTDPPPPCFRQQVPTALLLERPLVMSSTLLDAYPCLRKSRVHSLVSGCTYHKRKRGCGGPRLLFCSSRYRFFY